MPIGWDINCARTASSPERSRSANSRPKAMTRPTSPTPSTATSRAPSWRPSSPKTKSPPRRTSQPRRLVAPKSDEGGSQTDAEAKRRRGRPLTTHQSINPIIHHPTPSPPDAGPGAHRKTAAISLSPSEGERGSLTAFFDTMWGSISMHPRRAPSALDTSALDTRRPVACFLRLDPATLRMVYGSFSEPPFKNLNIFSNSFPATPIVNVKIKGFTDEK